MNQGKTRIVVTHNMHYLSAADKVIMMEKVCDEV